MALPDPGAPPAARCAEVEALCDVDPVREGVDVNDSDTVSLTLRVREGEGEPVQGPKERARGELLGPMQDAEQTLRGLILADPGPTQPGARLQRRGPRVQPPSRVRRDRQAVFSTNEHRGARSHRTGTLAATQGACQRIRVQIGTGRHALGALCKARRKAIDHGKGSV